MTVPLEDARERQARLVTVPEVAKAPSFTAVADEGRYRLTAPAAGVTLELDYVRREAHQLKGELLVRCSLPGAKTIDGVLSIGDLNLSSTRARQGHAKYLAERAGTKDDEIDFTGLLEEFTQRVLAAERNGQPAVLLADLPRPVPDEAMEVEGMPLLPRHPQIIFGDGGTTKSYLGLWVAGTLAQRGKRVALFDWELAGEDHRERLEMLFGPEMPDVHYARCDRSLYHSGDRLRRIVRENEIEFAIFDSIAFACDGPPESAEVAGRYFQALRQLGTLGSLHLAHVTKSLENGDLKPFGSAFWSNGARATWNVKIAEAAPNDETLSIALHNRKANLGAKRSSVGFEFRFGDERTSVRRVDIGNVPDLVSGLPVRQRMALALRHGSLSVADLADEIEADPATVSRTARRYKTQFTILDGGRLSLLETRR